MHIIFIGCFKKYYFCISNVLIDTNLYGFKENEVYIMVRNDCKFFNVKEWKTSINEIFEK